MRTIEEIFASNLKTFRERGDYTQLSLAETLGVSKGTVSAWEQRINLPEVAMLKNLSQALKVHPAEFFFDPELIGQLAQASPKKAEILSFLSVCDSSQLNAVLAYVRLFRSLMVPADDSKSRGAGG